MKQIPGPKARLKRRITAFLLAGMILAVSSACSKQPPANSIPANTGATLPSIGVPEGTGLLPSPTAESGETKGTASTTEAAVPSGSSAEETAAPPETKSGETSERTTEAPSQSTAKPTEPTTESRPKTEIHALSTEELNAIRSKYSSKVNGFGTGFRHSWVDADNRPTTVNNLLAQFKGTDANLLAYCSDVNSKCVAFSFQCGTEYGHTDAVLDILKKYDVKATFYIIHSYGEKNRALVKRMISEGHDIGSHTYSCPNGGIANWKLEDQMEDALKMQKYVQETFGYTMTKYNFNSGYWSEQAIIMMSRMGYQVDFCSCNYSDYDPNATFDTPALISDLEACLHPGCIYCFHTTNVITPTILEPLIQYCLAQGYRIVAVP